MCCRMLLSETRLGVRKDTTLCVLENETRIVGPRPFGSFATSSGLDDSLVLDEMESEVNMSLCVWRMRSGYWIIR